MLRFSRFEALIDFFSWPILDVLTGGGIGLMLSQKEPAQNMLVVTLVSIMFARVFLYTYFDIALNFLYEINSTNLINLFASPLTFGEWLTATMASGAITSIILIACVTTIAKIIFNVNLLIGGPVLLLLLLPLLLCGWALGYIATMILMVLGAHGQRIERIIGWVLMPFLGIYYSIDIMPLWVQAVSFWIPMSHIFKVLRIYMMEHTILYQNLIYGYSFSLLFFLSTGIACYMMFERARNQGLATLEKA